MSDPMWMSAWGLTSRPASHFLLGRAMRVVPGRPATLRVPTPFERQVWRAPLTPMTAVVQ